MSLSAFTNRPGTHQRSKIAEGFQEGQYYGWNGKERIYQNWYRSDIAYKDHSVKADFKRATTWHRSIASCTTNEPMQYRRLVYRGNPPHPEKMIDIVYDDHISNHRTPLEWFLPIPGSSNAFDESIVEALNNLGDNKAELGSLLAQARQTTDMFASSVSRFAGAFAAMKRGNMKLGLDNLLGFKGARGSKKGGTDLWLEFQYGWRPLMDDLYSTNQIVHDILRRSYTVRGVGSGTASNAVYQLHGNGWLWEDFVSSFSARTVLHGLVENSGLHHLNNAGLINPASIAWELVPWSFAIDWFVPVGQTLAAMTATYGLRPDGGWTSTRTVQKGQFAAQTYTRPWWEGVSRVNGGKQVDEKFSFDRYAWAEFPRTRVFADLTPFSTARALNAAALVRSLR